MTHQTICYPVDILVNGSPVKQYIHEGRIFIEAKENTEYEIQIKNNTNERVLALTSVDGLNVLNGQPASTDDIGYVINSYSSLRIKGFRYSGDKVAAFKFTNKDKAYAKSEEKGLNVGVIGVCIYEEYREPIDFYKFFDKPWWWTHEWSFSPDFDTNNPLSNTGSDYTSYQTMICSHNTSSLENTKRSAAGKFDIGTGWGKAKESKSREIQFKRGGNLHSLDIYYAGRDSLAAMGVPLKNESQIAFPVSFPRKYAQPPDGWKETQD